MNKKEEKILAEIINYVKKYCVMPSRRYLQKKFNYQSVNSISRYIKSLEKQNYLIRNSNGKLILNNYSISDSNIKSINIINANNQSINIILSKKKQYLAYKMHNNFFNNLGIIRNDILIIEKKKKLNIDDLGLFIIDGKYRIMKYNYNDGFYLLSDKEELILHTVKIIGKVILIERKM